MNIRPAREGDWSAIARVEHAAFGRHAYSVYWLRMAPIVLGELTFVAEAESVTGYAMAALDARVPGRGWILSVAVDPTARRQGQGRALSQRAVDGLQDAGASEIVLTVEAENLAAKHIYSDLGFRLDHRDNQFFGPGQAREVWRLG